MTWISQNLSQVGLYEKLEVTLTLNKTYTNPFDQDIVAIDAVLTCPDMSVTRVPGFYYREYEVYSSSPERYRNPGPEQWKIRFAPMQTGAYTFAIEINEAGTVTTVADAGSFTCVESAAKGFIRRDAGDALCLRHDDGSPHTPIGHNVCWDGGGYTSYLNYFNKMGAAGENWTRIWMTHFTELVLEWNAGYGSGYYSGLGRYSQQVSQRWDSIVEKAAEQGIALQPVLQHHGQFSSEVNPNWNDNPYNIAKGGFLNTAEEFFTNAEAKRLTKNKYRYIVARWGYSPAIFAWELWNEVQFTDAWRKTPSYRPDVIAWHQEMADYIRSIDPHNHPITTSSHETGFDAIWNHATIDFVQKHTYSSPTVESYYSTIRTLQETYNKPAMIAEFGVGVNGPENNPEAQPEPQRTQIYEGLVLHKGIWTAALTKSSANLWWWDGYIDPLDLYGIFTPLQMFMDQEDFAGLQQAPSVVEGSGPMIAVPGVGTFSYASPQTEFWYDGQSFPGINTLCKYLHGSTKPAEHRTDPIFHLTMPSSGNLIIHVNSTANWCSNSLKVMVNGGQVFSSSYPANSSNFDITVPLSAGQQAVQIINTGQDWFYISSYEFRPDVVPVVDAIGLMNSSRAYLWIYDIDDQYGQYGHGLISGQVINIPGLNDGRYVVTVWDTYNAVGPVSQAFADAAGGTLTYTLPDFTGDTALKITPAPIVDMDDLIALADAWLETGSGLPADVAPNGKVDLDDFRMLSEHWMDYAPLDWPMP